MKSQYHLGFILLDNRIIINYVVNQTYILTASKTRQIQVNCLLNLRYGFKYPTMVNIIKYSDILFYTFDTQGVNHLSSYAEFRLPPLQEHMLSTFGYRYPQYQSISLELYSFLTRSTDSIVNIAGILHHWFHLYRSRLVDSPDTTILRILLQTGPRTPQTAEPGRTQNLHTSRTQQIT